MKALVLSGGAGTRLRPITHTVAKQLVPVGNRPVLFHVLDAVAAAGITQTGIVVGDTRAQIQEAVGDGSRFGLEVGYLWQREPRGLADAVRVAQDFLGDDDFVMYLGDNIVFGGIGEFVERFRARRPAARVLLARVEHPQAFGVAEIAPDGRLTGLQEKPQRPRSDLAVVGVYAFSPLVHKAIAELEPSARGELEITDALQWLIDHGQRTEGDILTSYWKDAGNVPDILEANRRMLRTLQAREARGAQEAVDSTLCGHVRVEPGARIVGSTVVGPAVIGAGATVTNCRIGPYTSVAEGCRITDSWVRDSIIMPRASITGVHSVESSLIGQDAEIAHAPRRPGAHRLVLGGRSRVEIAS